MEQLFTAVDQALDAEVCDHILRFTESWLDTGRQPCRQRSLGKMA